LIGIINLHTLNCEDTNCPCKREIELYDINDKKFSNKDTGYHKDPIFLKHFIKKLFEDSLTRFNDSPLLNVAFAIYLFRIMKNAHKALTELSNASKKKPSLKLQFIIYQEKKL
jgi:hypothetical protein